MLCSTDVGLGIEPTSSCVIGQPSINWAPSLAQTLLDSGQGDQRNVRAESQVFPFPRPWNLGRPLKTKQWGLFHLLTVGCNHILCGYISQPKGWNKRHHTWNLQANSSQEAKVENGRIIWIEVPPLSDDFNLLQVDMKLADTTGRMSTWQPHHC